MNLFLLLFLIDRHSSSVFSGQTTAWYTSLFTLSLLRISISFFVLFFSICCRYGILTGHANRWSDWWIVAADIQYCSEGGFVCERNVRSTNTRRILSYNRCASTTKTTENQMWYLRCKQYRTTASHRKCDWRLSKVVAKSNVGIRQPIRIRHDHIGFEASEWFYKFFFSKIKKTCNASRNPISISFSSVSLSFFPDYRGSPH